MKLLFRRDQRSGMLGKQIFTLDVRADLSPEEKANIVKYKLGDTYLYQRYDPERASEMKGWSGFLASAIVSMHQVEIQVRTLEGGQRIECKSITEMLAVEAIIKEAATNFKAVLEASAKFGGEEVVEV